MPESTSTPRPSTVAEDSAVGNPRSRFSTLPLYIAFAATGVGVALPGAVLPVLLARWSLQDRGGGTLFFLSWIASSLGALFLSGSLLRALMLGGSLVALGSIGLTTCPASLAGLCMAVYGLGLGLSMTAISLLVQQFAVDTGKALVRLNLVWAVGACLCPVLALHTLRSGDLRTLLYPLATLFLLLAVWSAYHGFRGQGGADNRPALASASFVASMAVFFRAMPVGLIALVMMTTGVEASAGGWLATYAQRGGDPFSQVVAAPTCLWAGLLLSRLFWSFSPRVHAERWVIRASLLLMSASALLLLASRHGVPFLAAAACLGFGIGPAYPLLLARALRIHSSGTIFFLAGLGSACLPWLTGLVSSQRGSLRVGFVVPAAATLIMLALSFTNSLKDRQVETSE